MPKKWWAAFALLLSLGALSACAAPGTATSAPESEDPRPLVLTTFTVLADMARTIAGGHVRVESITKIGAEIGYVDSEIDPGGPLGLLKGISGKGTIAYLFATWSF